MLARLGGYMPSWEDFDDVRNEIEGRESLTGRITPLSPEKPHRMKKKWTGYATDRKAAYNRAWMAKKRAAFRAKGLTVLGKAFTHPEKSQPRTDLLKHTPQCPANALG